MRCGYMNWSCIKLKAYIFVTIGRRVYIDVAHPSVVFSGCSALFLTSQILNPLLHKRSTPSPHRETKIADFSFFPSPWRTCASHKGSIGFIPQPRLRRQCQQEAETKTLSWQSWQLRQEEFLRQWRWWCQQDQWVLLECNQNEVDFILMIRRSLIFFIG